jgi:oxygen-independent coproporphyrinogen-3 oxidase
MFLGLRLLDGMDLAEASAGAGADLEAKYRPEIEDLAGLGLLERQDGRLRLTESAYFIANQVFTRFVG